MNLAAGNGHMQSILVGSGWHSQLFAAEMSALVGQFTPILGGDRFLSSDVSIKASDLSFSATLDNLLQPAAHITISGEPKVVKEEWLTATSLTPEMGTIAVRSTRHGERVSGWSANALAGHMGTVLSAVGWSIDLEKPQVEIGLVVNCQSGLIVWGLSHFSEPPRVGWKQRSPSRRPFFKPISLEPRHARLMLNLVRSKGVVLDPMCGTGGIGVEASLMGISSFSLDLDEEMVAGAKENFSWAAENGATGEAGLQVGDATQLSDIIDPQIRSALSGVCVDPPYGRNAWRSEEASILFIKVCASTRKVVNEGSYLVCMLPSEAGDAETVHGQPWSVVSSALQEVGWDVHDKWLIPVHGSMGRVMVLARTV
jgi:putative methyltransferase (TIGR01177 family)